MEKHQGTKYYAKELFNDSGLGEAISIVELDKRDFHQIYMVHTKEAKYILRVFVDVDQAEKACNWKMRNDEIETYKVLDESNVNVPTIVHIGMDKDRKVTHYITRAFASPLSKTTFRSLSDRGVALFQAGADLARAHNIKGLGFGYDLMGLETNWAVAYKALIDNVIADAVISDEKIDTTRIYSVIERAKPFLAKAQSSLVHFSLTKSKVFVNRNGTFYYGLGGWYETIWGDFAGDFIPLNGLFPIQKNKYFLRGYRSVRPLNFTHEFKIRKYAMMLYLGLLMVAEPCHKHPKGSKSRKKFRKQGRKYVQIALGFLEKPFPDLG